MLQKFGTHKVQTVAELFALADKCTKAAEGLAFHHTCFDQPKDGGADHCGSSEKAKKRKPELVLAAEPQVRKSPQVELGADQRKAGDQGPSPNASTSRAPTMLRWVIQEVHHRQGTKNRFERFT